MRYWLFVFVLLTASVQADSVVVSGTTDIEDAWIHSAGADDNHGVSDTGFIQQQFANLSHVVIAMLNLENHISWPTETPTSGSLFVWCKNSVNLAGNLHAVCKPLRESFITYNDWRSTDSEWTTAGIGNGCDPCTYNEGDATGCDRTTTALDGPNSLTSYAWTGFEIDTAYFNGYLRDDFDQLVFRISANANLTTAKIYLSEFDVIYRMSDSAGSLADLENEILGTKVYVPFGCSLDSIQALIVTTASSKNSKGLVYNWEGSDSSLLATSAQKAVLADSAWVTFVFADEALTGGKNYLFAAWGASGGGEHYMRYKTSGGLGVFSKTVTYNGAPDPYTGPSTVDGDALLPLKVYVTDSTDHTPYFIVYYEGAAAGEINAIHEVGAGGAVHSVGTAGSAIHEP
jgi:hypothetical protein